MCQFRKEMKKAMVFQILLMLPLAFGQRLSSDDSYCKENNLNSAEMLRVGRNSICCLLPNFKRNVQDQAQREGEDVRRAFLKAKDVCCNMYPDVTKGVEALEALQCPIPSSVTRQTDNDINTRDRLTTLSTRSDITTQDDVTTTITTENPTRNQTEVEAASTQQNKGIRS